jgi:cytoskeletal protein RodZ
MADDPMSIGEYLKHSRLERRLQLEDISEELHIRRQYLAALEADEWDKLPGEVYAIGFLRSYARFLGVDADALVDYRRRLTQQQSPSLPERSSPATPVLSRRARKTQAKTASARVRRGRRSREVEPTPTNSGRVVLGAGFVLVALFVAGMFMLHNQPTRTSAPPLATDKSRSHSPKSKTSSSPRSHPRARKPAPPTTKPVPAITLTANNVRGGILTYSVRGGPLQLTLAFSGTTWVEVWKNGISTSPSGFTYTAGQTLHVSANTSLEFWAGTRLFSLTVDHETVSLPDPYDHVLHVTFVRS